MPVAHIGLSRGPKPFPNGARSGTPNRLSHTNSGSVASGAGAWAIVGKTESNPNPPSGDNGDMICLADPEALYELQTFVLDNLVMLVNENPHADKKISRAYIAVGDPVFECSQITVHANNIRMTPGGIDGNGYRYCIGEYLVDITAFVLRCYPTADVKPELLDKFARMLNYDASRMYWGFECLLLSEGVPGSRECRLMAPGIMNPVTPQAGVGGWTWTWTFAIQSC